MHELQIAYEEDAELQNQIAHLQERIAFNELQHGLVLDLNPFWDYSRRLEAAALHQNMVWDIVLGYFGAPTFALPSPGRADLTRRYPEAERVSDRVFGQRDCNSPFMLRILALPASSSDDLEARAALVAAARAAALPTIIETEPRAQLVHWSGERLEAPRAFGTLGGFVRDKLTGNDYAMTCGHVISAGEAAHTGLGPLGDCLHHVAPVPAIPDASGATPANQITHNDIALIKLLGTTPKNRATTIRAVLNRGDMVEMAGASSGPRKYEVGGLLLDLKLASSVWRNLIQLHAPTSGIFPQMFRDWGHPPPREGDSGAWIFHDDAAWGGMVVAASGQFGYALPATKAIRDANARFGMDLALA